MEGTMSVIELNRYRKAKPLPLPPPAEQYYPWLDPKVPRHRQLATYCLHWNKERPERAPLREVEIKFLNQMAHDWNGLPTPKQTNWLEMIAEKVERVINPAKYAKQQPPSDPPPPSAA
jgi:hypothetical protein